MVALVSNSRRRLKKSVRCAIRNGRFSLSTPRNCTSIGNLLVPEKIISRNLKDRHAMPYLAELCHPGALDHEEARVFQGMFYVKKPGEIEKDAHAAVQLGMDPAQDPNLFNRVPGCGDNASSKATMQVWQDNRIVIVLQKRQIEPTNRLECMFMGRGHRAATDAHPTVAIHSKWLRPQHVPDMCEDR